MKKSKFSFINAIMTSIGAVVILFTIGINTHTFWGCSTKQRGQEYKLSYNLSQSDVDSLISTLNGTTSSTRLRFSFFLALHGYFPPETREWQSLKNVTLTDLEQVQRFYWEGLGSERVFSEFDQRKLDKSIANLHYCWLNSGIDGIHNCEPNPTPINSCGSIHIPPNFSNESPTGADVVRWLES